MRRFSPALLAGAFFAGPALAQNPLELLLQQQAHYWFTAESVFGGSGDELEAADDFDVVATIQRIRAIGKSCFSCTPGDVLSARLRFYEWTSSGPGALQ